MERRTATGLALAFAAFASWGLLSPVNKRLLEDFEPMGLNAARFLLAFLVALPWLGRAGLEGTWRTLRDRRVVAANLLANASLTLFAFSLVRLEPTFSTLGFYTAPLWTAALAHFALSERVGRWFLPASAGLMAGGYATMFGFARPGPGFDGLGMALAIGSGVLWAVYTVYLRRHVAVFQLKSLMGGSFAIGLAYYWALALALEGPPQLFGHSAATYGWMAVMVAFPTFAAFVLFNAALQRAPAGQVNILIAMELAFTALFAAVLFGDRFTLGQLGGLAIALASVTAYLWSLEHTRRPHPP